MVSAPRFDIRHALLPAFAVLVVVGALFAAFMLVGSPASERRRWADSIRVENLQDLKAGVENYYREHKKLPDSLRVIPVYSWRTSAEESKKDPLTKQPYRYRVINKADYELGAVFQTDTTSDDRSGTYTGNHYVYIGSDSPFRKHSTGLVVFRFTATRVPGT